MKILVALPDAPHPPVSGGHWRDWQLLNLLVRAGHDVHVLFFATAATSRAALDARGPRAIAASVTFGGYRVEHPDAHLGSVIGRKLSYVMAPAPATHPQAYQYDAAGVHDRIAEQARTVGADAVVIRSFWCPLVPRLKAQGHLVIVDNPDYNGALTRELAGLNGGLRRIGPWANAVGVRRIDRRYLPLCDEAWVPTDTEARAMERDMALRRTLVLPNLLDVGSLPDYSGGDGVPGSMLLVANFDYRPNARAAERLLDEILPRVRRSLPDAFVTFVGDGLYPALRARALAAGCGVAGRVESVAPYYAAHDLVVLPVAEGAGMLVKAVEALAYGRCVAGLEPAFRGLPRPTPDAFVSTGSVDALATQVIRMLSDAGGRHALARRGRALAATHLSWEAGLTRLRGSILAGALAAVAADHGR